MSYLSIELKKTKRRGIWLVLTAFLFVFAAWMLYCVNDDQFLDFGWMMSLYNAPLINAILLPIAVAVFASRIIDMEHKGNTWKLLETQQSKLTIYLAKILYGFIAIFMFSVAEIAIMLLLGNKIGFENKPDIWAYALFFIFTLIITFNLFLLQMILSLIFHNQAVALCAGLCGSMAGLFMMFIPDFQLLKNLIPWGHYGTTMFVGMDWNEKTRITGFYYSNQHNGAIFFVIAWTVVLLLGGWLIFKNMDAEGCILQDIHFETKQSTIKKSITLPNIPIELIKIRRTPIWIAFVILPLISSLIGTFNYLGNIELLKSSWYSLWTQHSLFFCYFFMPPLIGVYAGYLWRLEHSGTNWNMLLVNRPAWKIVLDKLTVCSAITFMTLLWLGFLFIICGIFAGITQPIPVELIEWLICGFIGGLAICSLQCFLSLVIRSFAIPIGIALIGGIAGLIATAQGSLYTIPYALFSVGMRANNPERQLDIAHFLLSSVTFIVIFYSLSVWHLKHHDVRTA